MLIATCLLFGPALTSGANEPPSRDELERQADRCRRLLSESVLDFYLPHCVDTVHGGYLETLGEDGRFRARSEKFLTLQARQFWFFSALAAENR